jgi:TonB family protein
MSLRQLWPLFLLASTPVCLASVARVPAGPASLPLSLVDREHQVWTWPSRDSNFATVPHTTAHASCEASDPPEALATPDPLLDLIGKDAKVTVSFIIGTDGLVHSPLILESAGPPEDRTVLNTVRSWRYRPAMCNGVPTEAEAKVQFSSR